MKPKHDEYDLVLRARNGDCNALAELVEALRARLFGIAYAELRQFEDAQDAAAAALLRICQSIGSLRDSERLGPWADSIARNEARRLARLRGNALSLSDLDGSDLSLTEEEALVLRLDIQAALRRIPAAHARALTLFYLGGQPVSGIATQTGQPVGTVKSWLHHGRRNLADTLKEYSPMTIPMTIPSTTGAALKKAVLVHSDLAPDTLARVVTSLRARGYTTHLPDQEEIRRLQSAAEVAEYSVLDSWLTQFDTVVLDEVVAGHLALEHLINLRADPAFSHIAAYVLLPSTPTSYTASALFNAGANGLIFKDQPDPDAPLEFSDQRTVVLWQRFTERARLVVVWAREEALRLGETSVTTEHLLMGITRVPESLGARLLVEKNGLDLEALRRTLEEQITPGEDPNPDSPMELTAHATQALGLAQQEAEVMGHSWVGAEHMILGLLRQGDGLASKALAASGLTLEGTRAQVEAMLTR